MDELKNIRTFEEFKSEKDEIIIKISDGLYEMPDNTYLKWNWFSRSWKIVSGISDDILTKDLPDVNFDEIMKDKKIIEN